MAWVGSAPGRLPRWLEGRAASYASAIPYGLYRRVLSAWVRIDPEGCPEAAAREIERALIATFGPRRLSSTGSCSYAADERPSGKTRAGFVLAEACGVRAGRLWRNKVHGFALGRPRSDRPCPGGPALGGRVLAAPYARARLIGKGEPTAFDPDPTLGAGGRRGQVGQRGRRKYRAKARRLELTCLDENGGRRFAHTLLGDGDDEVVNAVCEGTGNNPLFMEERIASLLGTKAIIKADGKWRVAEETSGLISDRVTRLVRSKLDRLAQPQRDILAGATVLRPELHARRSSARSQTWAPALRLRLTNCAPSGCWLQ